MSTGKQKTHIKLTWYFGIYREPLSCFFRIKNNKSSASVDRSVWKRKCRTNRSVQYVVPCTITNPVSWKIKTRCEHSILTCSPDCHYVYIKLSLISTKSPLLPWLDYLTEKNNYSVLNDNKDTSIHVFSTLNQNN